MPSPCSAWTIAPLIRQLSWLSSTGMLSSACAGSHPLFLRCSLLLSVHSSSLLQVILPCGCPPPARFWHSLADAFLYGDAFLTLLGADTCPPYSRNLGLSPPSSTHSAFLASPCNFQAKLFKKGMREEELKTKQNKDSKKPCSTVKDLVLLFGWFSYPVKGLMAISG